MCRVNFKSSVFYYYVYAMCFKLQSVHSVLHDLYISFAVCVHFIVFPGGYFQIRRSGGLAPKFASEILVGAPNFASKNISDKYPKFCPLNLRYDPKVGTFPQLLRLVVTELPKFFLLFGELGRTLPQILPPNLM